MQAISSLAFGTPWGRVFTSTWPCRSGRTRRHQHMIHKLTSPPRRRSGDNVLAWDALPGPVNSEQFRVSFWRLMASRSGVKFCLIEFPKLVNLSAIRPCSSRRGRFGYRLAPSRRCSPPFCAVVSRLLAGNGRPAGWQRSFAAWSSCWSRINRDMKSPRNGCRSAERVSQSLLAYFDG